MRLVFLCLHTIIAFKVRSSIVIPKRQALHIVAASPPEKKGNESREGKITMQGLFELVSLGLGAPNLGKFKGVDKETGTLNFELESNRFIAKDGKEYNSFDNSKATYFEYGEVDESADVMARLRNFFGGADKDSSDSSSSKKKSS
uniref:Photosystem II reaction center Psb28 protein n=1 Tax=Aureoumbra lagunensis TaxID=44058 RepID=A0A7S3NKU3_9STRA